MTTMASQITSLTVVYSTVYADAGQRKHQSSALLAFVWGIHRPRWIPRTKGQLRGKCLHLMTSSWKLKAVVHVVFMLYPINDRGRDEMCRQVAKGTFKCIFVNGNIWILIRISLESVPIVPTDNKTVLLYIMVWHRTGDRSLSELVMILLTGAYISENRSQRVENSPCSQGSGEWPAIFYAYWLILCKVKWKFGAICANRTARNIKQENVSRNHNAR